MADQGAQQALDELGVNEDDMYREAADEIARQLDILAEQVEAFWISVSPQDIGEYVDSFQISDIEDKDGHPARRVTNTAKYAHIIEMGSEDTPEFAPRAKTASHFGCEGPYLIS